MVDLAHEKGPLWTVLSSLRKLKVQKKFLLSMDGSKVDVDQSQFDQGDPDFDIHILNHAEQILFQYIPAIWKALCPDTFRYIRSTEEEAYVDSR